jgi:hypothetical protein
MHDIKKETGNRGLGQKKAYEPPRAMRLDEMRNGAGDCITNGSGDADNCVVNGNSAGNVCDTSGNNARIGIFTCASNGSGY